jgi:hypothetical protein
MFVPVPTWTVTALIKNYTRIRVYSLAMDFVGTPPAAPPLRGMTAIGVFLLVGAVMAFIAGTSLTKRGTALDRMWSLNWQAYNELAPLGKAAGLLFLSLAVGLALAAAGWFKRRRWGWQLAVAIIGTQVLGDFANIFFGRAVQGLVGVTIAGALLLYITRPYVRAHFAIKPKQIVHANNP